MKEREFTRCNIYTATRRAWHTPEWKIWNRIWVAHPFNIWTRSRLKRYHELLLAEYRQIKPRLPG